jgi:NRPS condensation-like uncharacterized protein
MLIEPIAAITGWRTMPGARTPFRVTEEILHQLDRPCEPSTIQIEVRVSGSLDEHGLRKAVDAAINAHPMARARKASPRFLLRPARWEIGMASTGGDMRSGLCDDDPAAADARADFYSRPVDVGKAPALRLLLAHRPGGDSLLLSANHAVTDGVGALRFLRSVARAYDGRPDPAPDIDPIAARDLEVQFGRSVADRPRRPDPPDRPKGPCSLIPPEGPGEGSGYGFVLVALTAEQVGRLNPRRLAQDATLNDLLLAALHRTLDAWCADRGQPCDLISILMPVNLRPPEWRNEVVGNLSLGGSVLSTPGHRSSASSLLAAVTRQTRRIKDGDDYAAFLEKPPWVRKLLISLLLLRGVPSTDTAVLSNLGRLDELPDFGSEAGRLTEFWFSPPVVMPMGLAVGVAGLHGRLFLTLRYRRSLFGEEAAGRFVDILVGALTAFSESDENGPAGSVSPRRTAEVGPAGQAVSSTE